MVTSSAVVGSSAMSNCGRFTMAMAIMMRWRIPRRKLMRVIVRAASGVGDGDIVQGFDGAIPCVGA